MINFALGSAITIAEEIRKAIKDEITTLTASAGVSSINKFVAKIASDMKKPDGLTFIGPFENRKFYGNPSRRKVFGVGKITAAKMKKYGNAYRGKRYEAVSSRI